MKSPQTYDDVPTLVREFLYYLLTIRGRSPRTVEGYYIDLRTYMRYLKCQKELGHIPEVLSKMDCADIPQEVFLSVGLSDVYAYLHCTQQQLGNVAATRSRKTSALRSFYKYLNTKTALLPENPLKDLEVPTLRKSMPKYLTLEQSQKLLSVVEGKDQSRDYCIITLLLNCGMRLSELVGINTYDIRDNTIKLLGKGNKERVIYLNDACLTAIHNHLQTRKHPTAQEHQYALFLSSQGKRLSGRRVEQIVESNLKKAGLGEMGYSPHKLRHTAATLMYQHGNVDIRILKDVLGHANLGTTEIYTHVSSVQLEKAADASPLSSEKAKPRKKQGLIENEESE